jgi:hypothetical protein
VTCRGPVKTFFKGDEVATSIRIFIPPDYDVMKSMTDLSYGTDVRVKCRLGFERKKTCLCLRAENIDEVVSAKVIVN